MDIDQFLESEAVKEREQQETSGPGEFTTNRTIEEQIIKIKELIKQRNFIEAEKIYLFVKAHYATLEQKQGEERRALHQKLCEVNKELIESLNAMRQELEKRTNIIRQLLEKAKEYMTKGDMQRANKIYLETREMFKTLPEVFSEKKAELENEITYFYGQLVNHFHQKNYTTLTEKGKQIGNHITTAVGYLNMGDVEAAKREYDIIYQLYTELPEGYLYEKTMIYNQILTLHRLTESGEKTERVMNEAASFENQKKIQKTAFSPQEKKISKDLSLVPAIQEIGGEKKEKRKLFSFLKRGKKTAAETATAPQEALVIGIEKKISLKKELELKEPELEAPPLPPM